MNQRFDLILQNLFRSSSDDQVIRIARQIDEFAAGGVETLDEQWLQPVKRQVH